MSEPFDLIVVGGGVIGCAIAEWARRVVGDQADPGVPARERRRFPSIALVDAGDRPGSGATCAAAGGIAPHSDDVSGNDSLAVMAVRGRELYTHWLPALEAEARVTVPFHTGGLLRVALGPDEMEQLERDAVSRWREHGMEHISFTLEEMRERVPGLSGDVVGGYHLPQEACLDPRLLLAALEAVLVADEHVDLRTNVSVTGLDSQAGGVVVELGTGDELVGKRVVVAAGLASGKLLPELADDSMVPVKGQIVEFEVPGADGYPFDAQLYTKIKQVEPSGEIPAQPDGVEAAQYHSAFLVPRVDGHVVAGVTYEYGLDDDELTDPAYEAIVDGVRALLPEAKDWRVSDRWSGVRPATRDGLPIIGPLPDDERIIAATGHFGLGLTLAPATAELVCALLTADSPELPADAVAFSPARFAAAAAT
jgi:glycine oxidase